MPSHPAAQPIVDTALISESMAWEARWHMTLKNAPVLDTDLVAAGRQLNQYLIAGPSQATAAFVERLEQVVHRIEAVVAAKPSSQAFIYGDFPQTVMGLPEAPAAFLEPPVLPLAVAATGAPTSGPHQVPLPLNGTTNAPASSGAAAPGLGMAQARPGTGAQAVGGAALSQDMEQRLREAVDRLQAVLAAAPPALASVYQEPSGRRRLANTQADLPPHLHFSSHQENATLASEQLAAGLDAFLDGMEAATSHLEVLSAIGHGGWSVQGRHLLSEHVSAEAPSPAVEQLLVLGNHLHSLITGAPGPGTMTYNSPTSQDLIPPMHGSQEARRHVRHKRRKVVRSASGHHRWNHHRQLSEPAAAPPCCCDSAMHFEILVGAATLQAASSAAAVLTAQLPQAVAGAQQGACLALTGPPGLQQQMETPSGCTAMLLEAPARALGPAAPQPACPGSAEPRGWRCSHLKQPYVLEVPAYEVAAVSAAEGKCGLVGVTNVICGDVVMEAVTYEAITHGVCKPLCGELAPEPCAMPLSVYAPGIAPLPSPYVHAPALAPQPPACPGGGSSSWRCGGLTFDETTYNAVALDFPAGCTALSAEALLCSGTLLSPEAQAALGNRSCERVCERPQPCAAAAPSPVPARLPEPAPLALGSPVVQPAFLTFAKQTSQPQAQPPVPGANSFSCPNGASFKGQATCRFGNRTAHVEGSKVAAAVAAFSAGQCKQLNLAHMRMSQCGCVLYETALLIAAEASRQRQSTVLQQPFPARHKYQPAVPAAPFLAASAPPPASDLVCPCNSSQALRSGPNITFTYADTCPPSQEVAITPGLIYFQARVTFPDSVAATDADLASFVASSTVAGADGTCACGEDPLTAARSGNTPGAGNVQHISRVDCTTVLVTGYVPPAGYSAKETQISLEVLNGTVTSPCSGTFAGAHATTTVQMRPVPRLFPTNMALRDGLPVTASATALFMLAAQREIRPVGPADFLISGLFRNASVRTAAAPTGPAAWRVAVDLPPDFCGAATLGLADPTGIAALDDGLAACASAGRGTAVTFTRVCGAAGQALVHVVATEVVDPGLMGGKCIPPEATQ
ncbi:g9609 [Coccomyxa elongata]